MGFLWEKIARPAMFGIDAESAHELGMKALRAGFAAGYYSDATGFDFGPVKRFGLEFPNPVGIAAGFDKNGVAVHQLAALGFGFVEVGTVTHKPQAGNPKPRMFRLPEDEALINRLGFNNEGVRPIYGIIDITLYRDDLSTVGANPIVNRTELSEDIDGKCIVLVDDVLYTGRTIRAAMDQLMDFGRPRRVQLAVLIDRGKEHRELPIQADFVGKLVPTKATEIIKVMLKEFDDIEAVGIFERPSE